MAGEFLPLAGVGEKAIHVVSVRGRELVFDAPNFLQHQVGALVRLQIFCRVTHIVLQSARPACKAREGQNLIVPPNAASALESLRCALQVPPIFGELLTGGLQEVAGRTRDNVARYRAFNVDAHVVQFCLLAASGWPPDAAGAPPRFGFMA
jgi:hypothetical protein